MKVREVIRLLEAQGWRKQRQVGSHRQFGHPSNPNIVTVSGKPGKDVPIGTLKNILKKSGIKEE